MESHAEIILFKDFVTDASFKRYASDHLMTATRLYTSA